MKMIRRFDTFFAGRFGEILAVIFLSGVVLSHLAGNALAQQAPEFRLYEGSWVHPVTRGGEPILCVADLSNADRLVYHCAPLRERSDLAT